MSYLNPNRTDVLLLLLLCYQKYHRSIPASHSPLTASALMGMEKEMLGGPDVCCHCTLCECVCVHVCVTHDVFPDMT